MKSLDMNFATKKVSSMTNPTTIFRNRDTTMLTVHSIFNNVEASSQLGVEFDETATYDKLLMNLDRSKLVHVQTWYRQETTLIREQSHRKFIFMITHSKMVSA
ncbi:hypothetical protein ACRRTK_015678 [Alexandromys fortis]